MKNPLVTISRFQSVWWKSLQLLQSYLLVVLFLFLNPCNAISQVDTVIEGSEDIEQSVFWRNYLEQWAEQNEQGAISDDLMEMLTSLQETPINLNDTNSEQIMLLPFITEFQWDIIKAYISQNGSLFSLGELSLMNGFDSITLQLMKPFVTVKPVMGHQPLTLREVLRYGHSNLLIGTKATLEPTQGYLDSSYLGSPFRLYFRYYFKYRDQVCFQLSGDKDPGEEFFCGNQKQGFDYYGYYLMLKNIGRLRSAIVGKYQLQFGQGLTLWSGFVPWTTSRTSFWRYAQGIRPASALCEYAYFRGIAATVELKHCLSLTTFYSHTSQDASLCSDGKDTAAGLSQVQSIYSSGYHRTQSEIDNKNQLQEQLFGTNLQLCKTNFIIGATAYWSFYDKVITPANYIYNCYDFYGNANFVAGINTSYRLRRLLLFGEMSLSERHTRPSTIIKSSQLPLAGEAGLQFNINTNNQLGVCYRRYSLTYQNLHSAAIGQNSNNSNEEGISFNFQTLLPWQIETHVSFDFFRFPWLKYRVYAPSLGAEYGLLLTKGFASNVIVTVQYRYKTSGRNASLEDIDTASSINTFLPLQKEHSYIVEQFSRNQLQGSLEYHPSQDWRLITRIAYAWSHCEYHISEHGFLLLQDVSYTCRLFSCPLTVTTRYAAFDVSDYDARLYALEGDFLYEFGTPILLNQGTRCYLIMKCDISKNLALAVKYARTVYTNCENIGSGNDIIEGSHRQEIKLQVRLKW